MNKLLYFCSYTQKMNYLAHIFLSSNSGQTQIGNFIGDFVKGKSYQKYPDKISRGIVLHRKIDEFTDLHPVVCETIAMMRPDFGRYSGIILDMYFDYFLAINFHKYNPNRSLRLFSIRFYFFSILYYIHLPKKVKRFIFHFISTNRLEKYSSLEGLKQSLEIMSRHKSKAIRPDFTINYLQSNSEELEARFHQFFPDLVEFAESQQHFSD